MSEDAPELAPEPAGQPARALITSLIHHAYEPPTGFAASLPPVHKASTIFFPSVAALRARQWTKKTGYTYGLHGTPTTFTLEERIATLEGGRHTVLTSSGLGAVTLVDMALLSQGDEVLIPDNAYGPNKTFAETDLSRWGITHRVYDASDVGSLAAAITPATALVWLEAAGSVTMEFPDLRALVRLCRERGVLTALDNTWGAGIAFRPFDLGPPGEALAVDISIQALTKYPSGGGDVLMGSVTTLDEALHIRLKLAHMRLGLGTAGNDAETLLRSLPTIALRYAAQDTAARRLATWLQGRPEIARVLHPALPGAPGHAHWQSLCTAAAGLFSVQFVPGISDAQADAFVDALRLFRIGYSWAGTTSLAVPYKLGAMRSVPPESPAPLVRFALGLEDVDDLIADVAQALDTLAR